MESKYSIVYADPPWGFNNKNTGGSLNSGAINKYPTARLEYLMCLDIESIIKPDAFLFMWGVAAMPVEAVKVATAWGVTVKTMTAFDWHKTTKTGEPFFGMGFYTRQGSEHCLLAKVDRYD